MKSKNRDDYYLDLMVEHTKKALKALDTCDIDSALHTMQRTGAILKSSMMDEEIDIIEGRDIQKAYDAARKDITNKLFKKCCKKK